ncbi:glycosyltransferase family 2 protein [Fulvivirga sedimenti]|uniref:glycosyltransferase family 2 protein n=1 Tax=Fulvivirga sedimenti TaxID=2879465 RepID=UPI002106E28F|nr:glycosyltransferase [Fulvivirga sedimenti]
MQTYQHADFLKRSLDSVLEQETSFEFEILLGEDASKDGTREICIEYAERYPELIRLFLRERKDVIYIDKTPTGRFNFIQNLYNARGRYICLLDGDDYFGDPYKLQREFEFLEDHPDYVMCFHRIAKIDIKGSPIKDPLAQKFYDRDREAGEILWGNMHPATVMFRNIFLDGFRFPENFLKARLGDVFLYSILANYGMAKFLQEIEPSRYRIHPGGVWSKDAGIKKLQNRIRSYELMEPHINSVNMPEYRFILMNFYLDLTIESVKSGKISDFLRAYVKALMLSLSGRKHLKWFILFHFKRRFISEIIKDL